MDIVWDRVSSERGADVAEFDALCTHLDMVEIPYLSSLVRTGRFCDGMRLAWVDDPFKRWTFEAHARGGYVYIGAGSNR